MMRCESFASTMLIDFFREGKHSISNNRCSAEEEVGINNVHALGLGPHSLREKIRFKHFSATSESFTIT